MHKRKESKLVKNQDNRTGKTDLRVFQPKDLDKEDCWNACPAYYYQGSAHACCAYRVWIISP